MISDDVIGSQIGENQFTCETFHLLESTQGRKNYNSRKLNKQRIVLRSGNLIESVVEIIYKYGHHIIYLIFTIYRLLLLADLMIQKHLYTKRGCLTKVRFYS